MINRRIFNAEKRENFIKIKNAVLFFGSIAFICLFLFVPLMSKNDEGISVKAPLNGIGMIGLVFNGFEYSFTEANLGSLRVAFPPLVCIFMLLALVIGVAMSVSSAIGFFKRRESKLTGYLSIASCVWCLFLYIFVLSPVPIPVTDFFGVPKLFYQVFSAETGLLLLILAAILLILMSFGITERNVFEMKKFVAIYAMAVVPLVFMFVFFLYPILLQTLMAFKDYRLGFGMNSEWVGFQHFATIFRSADMWYVIGNTVYISVVKLVISIVFPLFLALIIFDIRFKAFRSVMQTIIYIPHFFSWVVVYAISYAFLSPEGVLNMIAKILGGDAKSWLTTPAYVVPIQAVVFGWKEIGWGTIIYFAALSGVDPSLYDAAKVDGAGPLRRLWNVSLPGIMPVVVFTMVLALGNVLKSAGGEQLLLYNHPAIYKQLLVIDTWIYWEGLTGSGNQLGLGAAMSFFQSFIGIVLVLGCNKLSKALTGRTIW